MKGLLNGILVGIGCGTRILERELRTTSQVKSRDGGSPARSRRTCARHQAVKASTSWFSLAYVTEPEDASGTRVLCPYDLIAANTLGSESRSDSDFFSWWIDRE